MLSAWHCSSPPGGGGDGAPVQEVVRQDFPDTALWEAHLRTGPSGEAQVTVPLPDSLTTWIVDVRAITADTRVGQAQMGWEVSKPRALPTTAYETYFPEVWRRTAGGDLSVQP